MLNKKEIVEMLSIQDKKELEKLFAQAYQVKLKHVGKKVYFRGIVELSNICAKDCFYCGIRRSNDKVQRYDMKREEVVESALWAYRNSYGSVVLQSGERSGKDFVSNISAILKDIKAKSDGRLGVTLSLGEQKREVYREWYEEGAHRYLLRIETSNNELYKKCHPPDHTLEQRLRCLNDLKEVGYQTGTGVLIGLPGQTIDDLANDILFFKEFDIDMIGMGPYIIHADTPFNNYKDQTDHRYNFEIALKMIAVCRILLKDVNIASTTALQAIDPLGREMGLKAGANIIMPIISDTKYREMYQLYQDKPCMDENADQCRNCLGKRIASIGEEIGFNEWGDSPHYKQRFQSKDE
jgi:biotin synthase